MTNTKCIEHVLYKGTCTRERAAAVAMYRYGAEFHDDYLAYLLKIGRRPQSRKLSITPRDIKTACKMVLEPDRADVILWNYIVSLCVERHYPAVYQVARR